MPQPRDEPTVVPDAGLVEPGVVERVAPTRTHSDVCIWERAFARVHPELSEREREIAVALLEGYRVATIARRLFLSPSTVRDHLSSIFRKVGVSSQAELVERVHAWAEERPPSPPTSGPTPPST